MSLATQKAINGLLTGVPVVFVCNTHASCVETMRAITAVVPTDVEVNRSNMTLKRGQGSIRFVTPDTRIDGLEIEAIYTDNEFIVPLEMRSRVRPKWWNA